MKLSEYFKAKTSKKEFKEHFNNLLEECRGKRILIFGAGNELEYFIENYPLKDLNIIAVADKKFKTENLFKEIRAINPKTISQEMFDYILVTNEDAKNTKEILINEYNINPSSLKIVIQDEFDDERESFLFLEKTHFAKNLEIINKKLEGKTSVIYGAGLLFRTMLKYYDLSNLNIIGVADRMYTIHDKDETFFNYKVLSPEEITKVNPNYVLISTKYYVGIIFDIYTKYLKNTKIKLKPLVKKSIWSLIKEA